MAFYSVLFRSATDEPRVEPTAPAYFHDLNLDRLLDAITKDYREYALEPFFFACLDEVDAITYRQEVMGDVEVEPVRRAIDGFSERMRVRRRHLVQAEKLHYEREKERWFLGAAEIYCDTVEALEQDLRSIDLGSRGLREFRQYLADYVASAPFAKLAADTRQLTLDLAAVRYTLLIRGGTITVQPYSDAPDYSAAVEETFARFRRGAVKDYRSKFSRMVGLDHVEAQILGRVALLHPETFAALHEYCRQHERHPDATIVRFDREIQFFVAYVSHLARLRQSGLRFCYPQLSAASKDVAARETFDLALAGQLVDKGGKVVCNDISLHGAERILVVTGPNQGGKTTFARMFGQLHHFASIGCAVPGSEARLFPFDRLFTHFEREENIDTLRGKLQDELVRIHEILTAATSRSIVIANEMFSSTTVEDAVYLSRRVMDSLSRLDLLGVWVTFLTELASFNDKTVSVVSSVEPGDATRRTYKLERRPAEGLAYALAIAQKHGVTYEQLKDRLRR